MKPRLLTALAACHSRHSGNLNKILDEIQKSIGHLSDDDRRELLQRLVAEMEAGEDNTKNIVARY